MKTPRTDKVAIDSWSGLAVLAPLEFTHMLEIENRKLKAELRKLKKKKKKTAKRKPRDSREEWTSDDYEFPTRLHHDAHDNQRMHNQAW